MIYSCLKYEVTGANGYKLYPKAAEGENLTFVGNLNDRQYYVGVAATEQHPEIDLQEETLTPEIEDLFIKSRPVKIQKDVLRRNLTEDIGDIHDMLADQSKMIEFIFVLLLRMAKEVVGGEPMSQETKDIYLNRINTVLGALDSGNLVIRGSYEDSDKMLNEVMKRLSYINTKVRDEYKTKIDEMLK